MYVTTRFDDMGSDCRCASTEELLYRQLEDVNSLVSGIIHVRCGVGRTSNPDPFLVIQCADALPWLCLQPVPTLGEGYCDMLSVVPDAE